MLGNVSVNCEAILIQKLKIPMYIYNITTNIDESVHDTWLEWMKETYIPAMIATGKFIKALMTQVQVNEEMGGITYAVQYTAKSLADIQAFIKEDAKKLNELNNKFHGKMVSFTTEMKIIHTHERSEEHTSERQPRDHL